MFRPFGTLASFCVMIAQKLAKVPKGLSIIAQQLAKVPKGLSMIAQKLAKVPKDL
jgi:NADPH:quinone reductase-like Zn-dependent oxidoreductase